MISDSLGEFLIGQAASEVVGCERVCRHLVAARDLASGDAVFTEHPLVVAKPDTSSDPKLQLNEVEAVALKLLDLLGSGTAEERGAELLEGTPMSGGAGEFWRKVAGRGQGKQRATEEQCAKALGITTTNAHGTCDGSMALFLMGSMMEHSCAPNACVDFAPAAERHAMTLRMLAPVAKGERITISYVVEYQPTAMRQSRLKKQHGFVCECQRCTSMPEKARAFQYACPVCAEDGCLCSPANPAASCRDLQCDDCGTVFTLSDAQWKELIKAEICPVICESCTSVLHPYHHKLVSMYKQNMKSVPLGAQSELYCQFADARSRLTGRSVVDQWVGEYLEKAADIFAKLDDKESATEKYAAALECYCALFGAGSTQVSRVHAKQKRCSS